MMVGTTFELRLHGDENMHFKFVRHFIDLVGLCLYSTAEYHGPEPRDVLDPKIDQPIIVDESAKIKMPMNLKRHKDLFSK